jgi:tetratricopeptide (TPR) repeat protein
MRAKLTTTSQWFWLAALLAMFVNFAPASAAAQDDDQPAAEANEPESADLESAEPAQLEDAEPEPAVEPEPEDAEASPAEEVDPAASLQELMQLAYAKTRTAESVADYTSIITVCESGLEKTGSDIAAKSYLTKLLAWGHNRRGKAYSEQASALTDGQAIADLEAQALADFEQAVKLDPKKWQAVHNRGVSYAFAGKFPQALADFNQTIKLNPKYPNVWFNRGEIYYQMGNYAAAIRDYTQASALSPDDAGAVAARGHAYYRLKQYRNALADYNKAVQMNPDNVTILTDRGEVYANLGYWQQAATDFRRAVELDASYGRAYMDAAWTMATCPDPRFRDQAAAITSAEKAIELDGESDWRYLDALAAAYANAAQFDKAQEFIAKAVEVAPEEQKQNLTARRELYAQKKPYRETARTASTTTATRPNR